jgi:hypothetical protein
MHGSSHTRRGATIAATAGLVLLAAACGGSSKVASGSRPSAGGAVKTASSARIPGHQSHLESRYLQFARCMRSHGVGDFPDPITGSGGHPGFSLQGGSRSDLNSNNPAFQRGVGACQHVLGHEFRSVFTPSGAGKGA